MNSSETLQKVMNLLNLGTAKEVEAEQVEAPEVVIEEKVTLSAEETKTEELADAPVAPPAEAPVEAPKDPMAELAAKLDALSAKLDILVAAAQADQAEDITEAQPAAMPMMSKAKEANLSAAKPFNGAPVEEKKAEPIVKLKTGDTLSRVYARLNN